MAKKLTTPSLSKATSKFNERIAIQVTDRFGETYSVEINKYFKTSEVQKLIVDYLSFKEELPNLVSDLELVKDNTYLYYALLVKYFTNVPLSDDLLELISGVETLIDIEVFDHIVGAFPKEEIERVNELIKKMKDNLPLANQLLGIENNSIEIESDVNAS
jgi:hypothetical protein